MTIDDEPDGLAISCDLYGTIRQVIIDRLGLTGRESDGRPFRKLLSATETGKAEAFLQEIVERGNVFDREMTARLEGREQTLHFLGTRTGETLMIIAARTRSDVIQLSWGMVKLKNIHAEYLKEALAGDAHPLEKTSTRELPQIIDETNLLQQELAALKQENGRLLAELAQMREEHGRREAFYRALFEQGAVGICFSDLTGKFVEFNRRFAAITGHESNELIGLHYKDITHPEDLDKDLEQLKQLLDGKIKGYTIEKRYRHKNGGVVSALVSLSLVRGGAEDRLYFGGVIEDITELREAQRALKKLAR